MKTISLALLTIVISITSYAQWQGTNPIYFNTGNVGIGTTTPQKIFEVRTGLNNYISIGETLGMSTNNKYSGIHFGYFESGNLLYRKSALVFERVDDAARGKIHLLNNGGFDSNSATLADSKLTIDFNGNVGIGTTAPDHKLHIKDGAGGAQLKFQRGSGIATIVQNNNANNLYIEANTGLLLNSLGGGNVGIGTTKPDYKLHIKDGAEGEQLKFQRGSGIATIVQDNNANNLYIEANSGLLLNSLGGGNVGIGTTDPGSFKLAVNGKMWTTEVQVAVSKPPDYVFEPTYRLSPLDSIKTYIDKNKHLPEVPSAKEMEKNGVNLGEMNMLLLKKIEELTLYVIELKKENAEEKEEIKRIKIEVNQLKK